MLFNRTEVFLEKFWTSRGIVVLSFLHFKPLVYQVYAQIILSRRTADEFYEWESESSVRSEIVGNNANMADYPRTSG